MKFCEDYCDFEYDSKLRTFVCKKCGYVVSVEDKERWIANTWRALLADDEDNVQKKELIGVGRDKKAKRKKNLPKYTMGDYIRSMPDEELARWLDCPDDINPSWCILRRTCYECILKWLKKPIHSRSVDDE